jgi:hypothetical protein
VRHRTETKAWFEDSLHERIDLGAKPGKESGTNTVMAKRFSRPGAALASATLALATLFLAAGGAEAAARKAKEPKAAFTVLQGGKPADVADPAATGSIGREASDVGCFTARRKLWVDGEGWIVRRVTTCR